jgi:hypothetical protein
MINVINNAINTAAPMFLRPLGFNNMYGVYMMILMYAAVMLLVVGVFACSRKREVIGMPMMGIALVMLYTTMGIAFYVHDVLKLI